LERITADFFGAGDKPAASPSLSGDDYSLTRRLFLRSLGLIYVAAYLSLFLQVDGLFSSRGVLPISQFLAQASARGSAFWDLPTLFWFANSDFALKATSLIGLSCGLLLALGLSNSLICFVAWALYVSITNTGQIFYGYGWETLLCETGFLAIFFAPFWTFECNSNEAPPRQFIWLLRWLTFRMMFGAGMIKIRGDECWRNLTCLIYHFETQPLPNPLTWYFHQLPASVLIFGSAFNHAVELVMPWLLFGRRSGRLLATWAIIGFQLVLILSGNLSWLNWLTIVIAFAGLDDRCIAFATRILSPASQTSNSPLQVNSVWNRFRWLIFILLSFLSLNPIANMLGAHQLMNASYDPLHLVNTYGAFGTVGKQRMEVVLEGTNSSIPNEDAEWREYEFKCKPGALDRKPCIVAPLQLRLDWQIWFSAMASFRSQSWLHHLLFKLFQGESRVIELLGSNPFPDHPPRFIRGVYYHYRLTDSGQTGWWNREKLGLYFAPIENPLIRAK
jgi:hypothetical protein